MFFSHIVLVFSSVLVNYIIILTSKLDSGFFADNGAVNILGHTDVRPSMFLLYWIGDHQIPPHQAVVFIWLLHELDFPVIPTPPSSNSNVTSCNVFNVFPI